MTASILTTLYNDYIKPQKRYILILVLVIIFGVAGAYAFKWFAQPLMVHEGAQNIANSNDRGGEVTIKFFYADWCPHCTKAKPQWKTFKSTYDGKSVNGYTIHCEEIDCTDGSSPYIQQYSVNGYPTLIMLKDNNKIDFDSKITNDNLTKFVESVLQK